jgi:uncharacterized membrane protein YdjX (TVP38/TMEM64 family)
VLAAVLLLSSGILVLGLVLVPHQELSEGWDLLWAGDPEELRSWLEGLGGWAPLASGVLQILSSLVPVLPGFVLAIANAMLYGALLGGALTFVTALMAAGACFGLARLLGRPGVERIVSPARLERVDRFMERRGLLAIFLGRLVPFINPDVVSYAAGATSIGWVPFFLAMGAGSVPATVFYSIVGAFAVESFGVVIAIVLVATLAPLAILWLIRDRLHGTLGSGSSVGGTSDDGEGTGSGKDEGDR